MDDFTIGPANPRSALWVADSMRFEDARELSTASGGMSPVECVFRSLAHSKEAHVVTYKREPHSVFGVVKFGQGYAPWMVGTKAIEKTPKTTTQYGKKFMEMWYNKYGPLYNWVDSRNVTHIRWLYAIGCNFGAVQMIEDVPFHKFEYRGGV